MVTKQQHSRRPICPQDRDKVNDIIARLQPLFRGDPEVDQALPAAAWLGAFGEYYLEMGMLVRRECPRGWCARTEPRNSHNDCGPWSAGLMRKSRVLSFSICDCVVLASSRADPR